MHSYSPYSISMESSGIIIYEVGGLTSPIVEQTVHNNLLRYTVLAPKRLECVLYQFYVIFSVILHAMDKLNIPQ